MTVQGSTEHYATLAAAVLQDRCAANRSLEAHHRSRYHSSRIPGITLMDYLRRVGKYSRCSPECLIIAVVYLDRYVAATHIPITFRNVHRLVIVAILVAAKIRDDIYYSNSYYGSIGGLHLKELNELELDFVKTLNWTTFVRPEEYHLYLSEITRRYDVDTQQNTAQDDLSVLKANSKEASPRPRDGPTPTKSTGAYAGASVSSNGDPVESN